MTFAGTLRCYSKYQNGMHVLAALIAHDIPDSTVDGPKLIVCDLREIVIAIRKTHSLKLHSSEDIHS